MNAWYVVRVRIRNHNHKHPVHKHISELYHNERYNIFDFRYGSAKTFLFLPKSTVPDPLQMRFTSSNRCNLDYFFSKEKLCEKPILEFILIEKDNQNAKKNNNNEILITKNDSKMCINSSICVQQQDNGLKMSQTDLMSRQRILFNANNNTNPIAYLWSDSNRMYKITKSQKSE